MATYSTLGITLLARKYKGTGRVVTFYTQERGKVEAVAQGIGKPTSKLAAAVESFTVSRLLLVQGKQLDRVSQAEVLESHLPLRTDMVRLAYASYIAEMLARTTESHHPDPDIYGLLATTLPTLCGCDDPELVLWSFMLRFFSFQGLAPELETCCKCGAAAGLDVCYLPREAGVACAACTPPNRGLPLSPEARAIADSLARMGPERACRVSIGDEARRQLRLIIDTHVEHQFGFEPKSRSFLAQVRAMEHNRDGG